MAPVAELVNALEFQEMARRSLSAAAFAEITDNGGDFFDRMSFRPRLMVNTTGLDLTTRLFGREMFAPIVIGPLAQQRRFHPEGELAMARGASAAKAVMIVPADSSFPLEQIVAQTRGDLWFQIYAEGDVSAARAKAGRAVASGCKAACLTLSEWDWSSIDQFRNGISAPVVLKGIVSAEEAKAAADRGVQGIIVSPYVRGAGDPLARSIDVLPGISEAVAGKTPILVDGGFRRGAHVLMALALGAQAVLIGRPALWALSAYGADGVQRVMELLQTELARDMAMCGRPNVGAIDRSVVRVRRT